MASIPKIVSTPLKWASKKVIHKTLLRFPGGDPQSQIACVYCPEMCRFSCPTAVVSGNDAVTPCNKMGLLYKEEKWPGKATQGSQAWPIYDCTGCGRCTEYCVYEMPVAERLFAARSTHSWDHAKEVAQRISDEMDPVGDLAYEVGDESRARERLQRFVQTSGEAEKGVSEPRSLSFLESQKVSSRLSWESFFQQALSDEVVKKLKGKVWLVHESTAWSRQLHRVGDVETWIAQARSQGIQLKRPFAQGKDCIDCGGEGAYPLLFPQQALQMAKELWERDQHRAQGILTISHRCAEHFRGALPPDIPVVSLFELSKS